jgi:hypothetical protein
MVELWDGVGKAAMAEPISHKRGLLVGAMLMLAVKSQWVRCKLDETIE